MSDLVYKNRTKGEVRTYTFKDDHLLYENKSKDNNVVRELMYEDISWVVDRFVIGHHALKNAGIIFLIMAAAAFLFEYFEGYQFNYTIRFALFGGCCFAVFFLGRNWVMQILDDKTKYYIWIIDNPQGKLILKELMSRRKQALIDNLGTYVFRSDHQLQQCKDWYIRNKVCTGDEFDEYVNDFGNAYFDDEPSLEIDEGADEKETIVH
jgi:hypothetical protein